MTRAYNTATTQQNSGGAVAGVTAGKNIVINGAFDNWQRGTSFNSSTDTSLYTADRFQCYSGAGSNVTLSRQSSGLTGFQYCARIARTAASTATNLVWVTHTVETAESLRLAGQTATLSFWMKTGANFSPTSSAVSVQLLYGTGTNNNILNGFTGETSIVSTTINPTTTWTRYTFTASVPSTATQLAIVLKHTPTGTAGAADYYDITGIQVEAGSVATPFSRAGGTIAGELAACQRYYSRVQAVSSNEFFGQGPNNNASGGLMYVTFPVRMRVAPTSIDYSLLFLQQYDNAGNYKTANVTSITLSNSGTQSANCNSTTGGSAFTTGGMQLLSQAGLGYLGFNAEL